MLVNENGHQLASACRLCQKRESDEINNSFFAENQSKKVFRFQQAKFMACYKSRVRQMRESGCLAVDCVVVGS